MNPTRTDIGRDAENRTLVYFESLPCVRVLERDLRRVFGEIDFVLEEILASGKVELVFVEVRYRKEGGWVKSADSVVYSKRRRIERVASEYLCRYRGNARSLRFDVLAWNGNVLDHLKDAWRP